MDQLSGTAALACSGFRVGQLVVPPFQVGRGEIVKIVCRSRDSNEMHIAAERICNDGRASSVELPMPPSWLREVIHRQTAAEWLIAHCEMTRQDAADKLKRVQVNPDAPLCQLAGNPRWMIGFIAAMNSQPTALVFTTSGCDPLGVQAALTVAAEQLGETGGVYLTCFPDVGITEPAYSAVIEIPAGHAEKIA
jgi:hypothetical protein